MSPVYIPPDYVDPSPKPEQVTIPLTRAECIADEKHPAMWVEYDEEDWYPPVCMWCTWDSHREAHGPCEHSHHWPWRRWKATRKVVLWLHLLGILNGHSTTFSFWCHGCVAHFRWSGKRGYLLGLSRDTWRCLLRGHHIPGDLIAFGYCAKCLPCPECGSRTAGHADTCESYGWRA